MGPVNNSARPSLERAVTNDGLVFRYRARFDSSNPDRCVAPRWYYTKQHPSLGLTPLTDLVAPASAAIYHPLSRKLIRALAEDWPRLPAGAIPFRLFVKLPLSVVHDNQFYPSCARTSFAASAPPGHRSDRLETRRRRCYGSRGRRPVAALWHWIISGRYRRRLPCNYPLVQISFCRIQIEPRLRFELRSETIPKKPCAGMPSPLRIVPACRSAPRASPAAMNSLVWSSWDAIWRKEMYSESRNPVNVFKTTFFAPAAPQKPSANPNASSDAESFEWPEAVA